MIRERRLQRNLEDLGTMRKKDGDVTRLEKTQIEVYGIPDFVNSAIFPVKNKLLFQTDKKSYEITYEEEDINKKIENELNPKILGNMYAFQKQGVKFGLDNNCRVLIADEMGVGKTIQAICLACCYKSSWPLLVICPSSLKYNWKEEILKWNPALKDMQIQILSKQSEEIYIMTRVLIVSYDLAPKIEDKIKRFKTNIVIADEAHYMKNAQAKRTTTLLPILQKIKHVILLTGTPAFARPKEMYTLLSIIRPDIFKVFKHFGDRYCDPKPAKFGGGTDYSGSSNEKELFYILKKSIMIRRLKQDVLTQLPKKRRKKVHVNVDPKILAEIQSILNQTNKSSLEQLFEQAMQDDDNQTNQVGLSKFSALNQCYQLSGKAKLEELKNYVRDLLENDIKIIVFAHHQEIMNALEMFVSNELKLKFIRIDGQVAAKNRFEYVQQFQTDPDVKVAILSLSAASTGLTLTASSNIVFAEMNWTPAIMQQAEDRAHRIGQENSVLCHYIVGEKTLDDMLYKKIEQKLAIVSNILDGEQKRLKIDEVQNIDGDIQNFSSSNKKEGEEYEEIEEDIQIQTGSNYSAKKQTYSQSDYIKQLLQQKENQKLLESQQVSEADNQMSIESDLDNGYQNNVLEKPPPNAQINQQDNQSESEDEDDDEELFIMKMIALQANKPKVKESQEIGVNNGQNININKNQVMNTNINDINNLFKTPQSNKNNQPQQQNGQMGENNNWQIVVTNMDIEKPQINKSSTEQVINKQMKSLNTLSLTEINSTNQQKNPPQKINQTSQQNNLNKTPNKSSNQQNLSKPTNNNNQSTKNEPIKSLIKESEANEDDYLFDSESDNESSKRTISLSSQFQSIQNSQQVSNNNNLISEQKSIPYSNASKANRLTTGFDFLDDFIDGGDEEDIDEININSGENNNQFNNSSINKNNEKLPNEEKVDIPSAEQNKLNYLQNGISKTDQKQKNENNLINPSISPLKSAVKSQQSIQQKQLTPNDPKKRITKSVEKQDNGITKITFENGDVRYVSDSDGEENDEDDDEDQKYDDMLEDFNKNIANNRANILNQNKSFNQKQNGALFNNNNNNKISQNEISKTKQNLNNAPNGIMNLNTFKNENVHRNGGVTHNGNRISFGQQKNNNQLNNLIDESDKQFLEDVDFDDFHEKFKSTQKSIPTRNIRGREEFEKGFIENNGQSGQNLNNIFNTIVPEKQQQISKKQIFKFANQHF